MAKPIEKTVILERITTNKIADINIHGQLNHIKMAAMRNRAFDLRASLDHKTPEPVLLPSGQYKYEAHLRIIKKTYRSSDAANRQINKAIKTVEAACKSKSWRLLTSPDDATTELTSADTFVEAEPFVLPPLTPQNKRTYFDGIYERDSHINLIYRSAKAAVDTNFTKRSHVLLFGKPACAKTTIFTAFKAFFEDTQKNRDPENEVLVVLDATTLTKAGLERWILDRAKENRLPNFLCIEELEKHQPDNLLCMLSIMDGRAQFSRMNANIGQKVAKTPMVIYGTCNNSELLKSIHKGALWSRFQHRFECTRPSRELMKKILLREIEKMDGNVAWADPALHLGYDVIPTLTGEEPDPRQCIAMLDGQDGLLDGSYEKDIRNVIKKHS